jgi:hypothetical protein
MKKKKSVTVHTTDGQELVFTSRSFDYCCGNPDGGSYICINGDETEIVETPAVVSNLLDELED